MAKPSQGKVPELVYILGVGGLEVSCRPELGLSSEPLRIDGSVWISLHYSMTETNAKHRFAFIPFDCLVYTFTILVTDGSAKICDIDRRLLAGCKPMPYPSVIAVHVS